MKYFVFVITACLSLYANAQHYTFNYVHEVEHRLTEDAEPSLIRLHTNSDDNTFIFTRKENESRLEVLLHDEHGIGASDKVQRETKMTSGYIFKCSKVLPYKNITKELQQQRYMFEIYSDTLINEVSYIHYAIKPVDADWAKKKNLGTLHYIVDKTTSHHLPILLLQIAALSEYEKEKGIPAGIFKEKYFIMPNGKKEHIERVIAYRKENFTVLAEQCK